MKGVFSLDLLISNPAISNAYETAEWITFPCDIERLHGGRVGKNSVYLVQNAPVDVLMTGYFTHEELNSLAKRYLAIEEFIDKEAKKLGYLSSQKTVLWSYFGGSIDRFYKHLEQIKIEEKVVYVDGRIIWGSN